MFPWNIIPPYETCSKFFFNNKQDYDFVLNYAKNTTPTDFDLLIQLSDGLANKDGFVTLEERQREYFERRGYEMPQHVVQSAQKLKDYFDTKIGKNIYHLLKKQGKFHVR